MNKDWYKLNTISKNCDPCVMFGITSKSNVQDFLYPNRSPRRGSTVLWNPEKNAHISIGSYVEACRSHDEVALEKLKSIGIPADINFGYSMHEDMSSTYTVIKTSRKKTDSIKIMRAQFADEFEDGTKFSKGDVIKIFFRKKFEYAKDGSKKFKNIYKQPSSEELEKFLKTELI